jgi:DtxR family manganese transport transcriptional regulator
MKEKRKSHSPRTGTDPAARQASAFRAARIHHASENAEDYVELIDELIRERGEARSVDMARRLGVSHVTVTKTLKRLRDDLGLVSSKPYRSIFLTEAGLALARRCRQRHHEVVAFLTALGVPPAAAEIDAEGIEHHVSAETLQAMRRFTKERARR